MLPDTNKKKEKKRIIQTIDKIIKRLIIIYLYFLVMFYFENESNLKK